MAKKPIDGNLLKYCFGYAAIPAVGADSIRPCRKQVRIRINARRIGSIVPSGG